jgi:hypothetical protein
MEKKEVVKRSLVSAAGVVAYVAIVAWIMNSAERWFGDGPDILGGIAFLLLFVVSAATVGLAIFGQPVMLYLDGQKRDAIKLLTYTLVWLLIAVAAVMIILTVI